MNSFEKWWGEDQFHRCWPESGMRRVLKQMARRVWIGVLKWVIQLVADIEDQDHDISPLDIIKKELKEME